MGLDGLFVASRKASKQAGKEERKSIVVLITVIQ